MPAPLLASARPSGSWSRAALLLLFAWAALLCTGLGSHADATLHSLAGTLPAQAQHAQRHTGASLATRSARRDHAQIVTAQPWAPEAGTGRWDHAGAALPLVDFTPRLQAQPSQGLPQAGPEAFLTPRFSAHLSRAPPARA